MNLLKILTIIVALWLILKVKRFISSIHVTSKGSFRQQQNKIQNTGMDIQDADYEEVE